MTDNVLVTGGAGYIGSHTCKALAESGFQPIAYDNLIYGHREAVKWGPLVEADLTDRDALQNAIRTYRPQAVIHFAAYTYVGESAENPGKYFQNNVVNSLALLEAMRDADLAHIVFSSSCAVYGLPDRLPITEDMPKLPMSPYGESKLIVERMLSWFDAAHSITSVSLRYFNAAGADFDGMIGEAHDPETHLIPLVINAALGRGPAIKIFGTDYPTPDGTAIRDYIHVSDLAAAHVKALGYLIDGGRNCALNLGTGKGHSVQEIIEAVERIAGLKVPATPAPRRVGDPPELVAGGRLAQETLGWLARHTDINEIVRSAYLWHTSATAFGAAAQ